MMCRSYVQYVSRGRVVAHAQRVPVFRLTALGTSGGIAPDPAPPAVARVDRATPRAAVRARAPTAAKGVPAAAPRPAVSADVGTAIRDAGIPATPAFDVVRCDVRPRTAPVPRLTDGPLRRKAAARFLGVAADTLSCWRQRGCGPAFEWLDLGGRRVAVYALDELERFKAAQAALAAKPTQRDQREAARARRMPPPDALDAVGAAALIGMELGRFRAQVSRGRGPKPCGRIGLVFYFLAPDVRNWLAGRPKLAAALATRGDARAASVPARGRIVGGDGGGRDERQEAQRVDDDLRAVVGRDEREHVERALDVGLGIEGEARA